MGGISFNPMGGTPNFTALAEAGNGFPEGLNPQMGGFQNMLAQMQSGNSPFNFDTSILDPNRGKWKNLVAGGGFNPMANEGMGPLGNTPTPPGFQPQQAGLMQLMQMMQPQQSQQTASPPPQMPQPTQTAAGPTNSTQQLYQSTSAAPFAANPYEGFTNTSLTAAQRLPLQPQPLTNSAQSPEDWVYKSMMAGMGSPVPGSQMATNQLVPGSTASSQYVDNPYTETLANIIDPTAPVTPPDPTTDPVDAWLAYDLNKNGKLGKKEKKAWKSADLDAFKAWKAAGKVTGSLVPPVVDTGNPYDPYHYISG